MRPDISVKSVFIFFWFFFGFLEVFATFGQKPKKPRENKKQKNTKKQKNRRLGDYMRPDISLKSLFFFCFFFGFLKVFLVFDQK